MQEGHFIAGGSLCYFRALVDVWYTIHSSLPKAPFFGWKSCGDRSVDTIRIRRSECIAVDGLIAPHSDAPHYCYRRGGAFQPFSFTNEGWGGSEASYRGAELDWICFPVRDYVLTSFFLHVTAACQCSHFIHPYVGQPSISSILVWAYYCDCVHVRKQRVILYCFISMIANAIANAMASVVQLRNHHKIYIIPIRYMVPVPYSTLSVHLLHLIAAPSPKL